MEELNSSVAVTRWGPDDSTSFTLARTDDPSNAVGGFTSILPYADITGKSVSCDPSKREFVVVELKSVRTSSCFFDLSSMRSLNTGCIMNLWILDLKCAE